MTSTNQDLPGEPTVFEGSQKGSESSDPQPEANTPPNSATTGDPPAFGWSAYAERVNGRFAMIGLVAVLLIEVLSRDTFLHWAGLMP
ncbi:MAG TPA: chlorophyll a/b-binding protein [Prochlorococcus sp.]|nr:chlorophyll a/b-binding protein [Prochlorococcaceae cyanobacterium ETNP18_MAG_14]HJM80075.1 chlorophyll a/b-binding protein [Prochlorococcaceae cyanobacterium Fu_MAG_72]